MLPYCGPEKPAPFARLLRAGKNRKGCGTQAKVWGKQIPATAGKPPSE